MFSQACVILFPGGVSASVHAGVPPSPRADTPWEQTPWEQTPRQEQTPPGADTPWSRHPSEADPTGADPSGADPQEQTHQTGADTPPPRADTPSPPPAQSMMGDTVNARAVRIRLECNLV